jgi:hypothetical protein
MYRETFIEAKLAESLGSFTAAATTAQTLVHLLQAAVCQAARILTRPLSDLRAAWEIRYPLLVASF